MISEIQARHDLYTAILTLRQKVRAAEEAATIAQLCLDTYRDTLANPDTVDDLGDYLNRAEDGLDKAADMSAAAECEIDDLRTLAVLSGNY